MGNGECRERAVCGLHVVVWTGGERERGDLNVGKMPPGDTIGIVLKEVEQLIMRSTTESELIDHQSDTVWIRERVELQE